MTEERIPVWVTYKDWANSTCEAHTDNRYIKASDIERVVAIVVGRMAQSCRVYAREHSSDCTMEAFLGFLGCCQQELDQHAVDDVIDDEDTPAPDTELVTAARELVDRYETQGWAFAVDVAKVKSLLPPQESGSEPAETTHQCERCQSTETTFHGGQGWLCGEHAPYVIEFGDHAPKPDLREAAERVVSARGYTETDEMIRAINDLKEALECQSAK